jgi:hypothetical protein
MNSLTLFADQTIGAQNDPTWFYSTLAQTAAALVGLLAAVLISRIVAQMAAMQQDAEYIRRRIHNALCNFEAGRKSATSLSVGCGEAGDEMVAFFDELLGACEEPTGDVDVGDVRARAKRLRECLKFVPEDSPSPPVDTQQFEEYAKFLDSSLADKLAEFRSQLLPKPLWMVLALLGFLTAVGVGWPLVELGILTGSSGVASRIPWMLGAFSLGVVALLACLFVLTVELKQMGCFKWKRMP